jgi:UPF0716 family protein affecting phage T7 exclusion
MESKLSTKMSPLKWLLFGAFLVILVATAILLMMPGMIADRLH